MASNDDIMHAIGRLEAQQDGLSKTIDRLFDDFADERRQAHESRARIHERLDEQAHRIGESEKTIVVAGATVAQQRDIIALLKATVDADVTPTINEWKRIKFLGGVLSGALIALGVTAATVVAWLYDWLAVLLRYWGKVP
ncbi:hypothetical protein B5P46_11920 [Rhizobium leguminosarum]|uniref:DUF1515 domain-containing protein n=1 Tax=Rhizobium leguminosarum TaxID=384 RepID=A0A4V1P309_RHILE|nr:DUF1515 domain-containing protein [Rhizobium leguminosarum]RXT29380.1 hypothetical protein B5P46_11920 [Rhizobium leguminosarum]